MDIRVEPHQMLSVPAEGTHARGRMCRLEGCSGGGLRICMWGAGASGAQPAEGARTFLMIMTRNGNFIPNVFCASTGQVM